MVSEVGFWHKPKRLAGYGRRSVVVKEVVFEACTYDYGFLIALNLAATVSSGQAWQVQRQSVLSGLGVIG
jgi:hypothetical protein